MEVERCRIGRIRNLLFRTTLSWHQGGPSWTAAIVCRGEGVAGGLGYWKEVGHCEQGEEGKTKPTAGHRGLSWEPAAHSSGSGDGRGEHRANPVRIFFVKVKHDGFSRTHRVGYFDPVPTRFTFCCTAIILPLILSLGKRLFFYRWKVSQRSTKVSCIIFFVLWKHNVGVNLSSLTVILQSLMVYSLFLMTWHTTNCVTLFSNDRFNILCFNRLKLSFRRFRTLCVRTVLTTGWTHSVLVCSETTSNVYESGPNAGPKIWNQPSASAVCVCPKPSKDLVWQAKTKHLEVKCHQRCDKGATGNTERLAIHQRASGKSSALPTYPVFPQNTDLKS